MRALEQDFSKRKLECLSLCWWSRQSAIGAFDTFDCFLGRIWAVLLGDLIGIHEDDPRCLLLGESIISELTGKPETMLVSIAFSGAAHRLIKPLLARRGREAQVVRVFLVFTFLW